MKEKIEDWRSEMVERVVEHDDELMEKYLASEEITEEELKMGIRKATIENKIFPVLTGTALKNKGVQLVLDAVIDYLPSPAEVSSVEGIKVSEGRFRSKGDGEQKESEESDEAGEKDEVEEKIIREPKDDAPFAALAFKVATDPFVGQLVFFRVYSGSLTAGSYILNSIRGEKERIGRILRMHADHREEMKDIYAGDIAAAVGLKNTTTGDTLCSPEDPIILEKISFPEPVISIAVEPKTKADQEKMGIALKKLSDEDPTFQVKTDEETGQTIISGMGELHLEVYVERMKRDFDAEVVTGVPQVAYREAITREAHFDYTHKKQTGGAGQYGRVAGFLEPSEKGDYEFINKVKGGVIPTEFLPAVDKGFQACLKKGLMIGFPILGMKVTVNDGKSHSVDSSEMAFNQAAIGAFKQAYLKAKPVILEPVMKVSIEGPSEFQGNVMASINQRRGLITSSTEDGVFTTIEAEVPLAEMFGYATTLRSLTQGKAEFTMEFVKYAKAPESITEEL